MLGRGVDGRDPFMGFLVVALSLNIMTWFGLSFRVWWA